MKKKNISFFLLGITIGVIFLLLFQNTTKFLSISKDEAILDTSINVLANILSAILSAVVAFLVAYFQIKKEKIYQEKENDLKTLKYLKVLKYENETNLYNVNQAIKAHAEINPENFLKNIDNIMSMNTWNLVYLDISISENCYDEISKLNRTFRKIKGTPQNEFEVNHITNLVEPLTTTISLTNLEIQTLEAKINKYESFT